MEPTTIIGAGALAGLIAIGGVPGLAIGALGGVAYNDHKQQDVIEHRLTTQEQSTARQNEQLVLLRNGLNETRTCVNGLEQRTSKLEDVVFPSGNGGLNLNSK